MAIGLMTASRLVHLHRLSLYKAQVLVPLASSFFQGIYRSHGRHVCSFFFKHTRFGFKRINFLMAYSPCCQTEIYKDSFRVASKRNSLPGVKTFCTGEDLSIKKCVPCNAKDLQPMTEQAAQSLVSQVSEWSLVHEDGKLKLRRSLKVKSFLKGLDLLKMVADVAEAEGHHPDLHLAGWNNVTIEILTHAVGGLTENDFILAAKIDKLDIQDLLRKKPTGCS